MCTTESTVRAAYHEISLTPIQKETLENVLTKLRLKGTFGLSDCQPLQQQLSAWLVPIGLRNNILTQLQPNFSGGDRNLEKMVANIGVYSLENKGEVIGGLCSLITYLWLIKVLKTKNDCPLLSTKDDKKKIGKTSTGVWVTGLHFEESFVQEVYYPTFSFGTEPGANVFSSLIPTSAVTVTPTASKRERIYDYLQYGSYEFEGTFQYRMMNKENRAAVAKACPVYPDVVESIKKFGKPDNGGDDKPYSTEVPGAPGMSLGPNLVFTGLKGYELIRKGSFMYDDSNTNQADKKALTDKQTAKEMCRLVDTVWQSHLDIIVWLSENMKGSGVINYFYEKWSLPDSGDMAKRNVESIGHAVGFSDAGNTFVIYDPNHGAFYDKKMHKEEVICEFYFKTILERDDLLKELYTIRVPNKKSIMAKDAFVNYINMTAKYNDGTINNMKTLVAAMKKTNNMNTNVVLRFPLKFLLLPVAKTTGRPMDDIETLMDKYFNTSYISQVNAKHHKDYFA